ncbi:hypothetical protein [Paraburkholderia strydomiana]|uniref:hypothetical protein n=1 Tax=Paraburkholderia strydomiana TaxID=1245417 RepID=UPI001BEBD1EB|nr:hypothetical protein [Paraburkholderia strydomiana]MBT2792790.1 hypothetical protein [Paraburkholderia strydomiana]
MRKVYVTAAALAGTLMCAVPTQGAETDAARVSLNSAHPLPDASLEDVKDRFRQLTTAANRHDAQAIEQMFWDSPSALLVAKSVDAAEGNWAGFWGPVAVARKLQGIYAAGTLTLYPDWAKVRVVGISSTVAQSYAPMKIAVSYGGQDPSPRPFIMIIEWLNVDSQWRIASEIILPVPSP